MMQQRISVPLPKRWTTSHRTSATWSSIVSLTALAQLARSVVSDWSASGFWSDLKTQRGQVADYIIEQGTIEKMESAFCTYEPEEVSDEFAAAVDELYCARKRRSASSRR